VLKRDGTAEPFDEGKLCGCMLRAMRAGDDDAHIGQALAHAVGYYLLRRQTRCISTGAILEMALTVLRVAGLGQAATQLERRHAARLSMRGRLRLHHDNGVCTAWSKQWLVQQGCTRLGLGPSTARILAAQVEQTLTKGRCWQISRSDVIAELSRAAEAYGLLPVQSVQTAPGQP